MLQNFWISLISVTALCGTVAQAATNLKKVQITDGSVVELIFDGKINPNQIKTEFVRDNIQLSFQDVSVYPAKVSMVSGKELTKVFAYQYSPKLVRARFTVKGDAAQYQGRMQMKVNGKVVSLRIAGGKVDKITTSASSTETTPVSTAEIKNETEKTQLNAEEQMLLTRVLGSEESSENKEVKKVEAKSQIDSSERGRPLTSAKSLPSPMRSIGVMIFILGLLGVFFMFMKRLKPGKNSKGLGGFLGKLSSGLANKNMIEVVSTHHLAPKKSIVIVRIQNRMLVLGMTNDAVNLITEFKANDSNLDDESDDLSESMDVSEFAVGLKKLENGPELKKTSRLGALAASALGGTLPSNKPQKSQAAVGAYQTAGTKTSAPSTPSPAFDEVLKQESTKPSIRAQIKNRVDGMKQL